MKLRHSLLAVSLSGSLTAAPMPLPDAVIGSFAPVPAKVGTGPAAPAAPMESAAPSLNDCANAPAVLKALAIRLTPEQTKQLETDRFLLVPIETTSVAEPLPKSDEDRQWSFTRDEMLSAFAQLGGDPAAAARNNAQTRLVTSDVALHAWHRAFARTLEYIEQRRVRATLADFLAGALANARELRAKASEPAATRLAWTEARFAAPWILLGPPPPPDRSPADEPPAENAKPSAPPPYQDVVRERLAQAAKKLPPPVAEALGREITLVLEAKGMTPSPLFGSYDPDKPADYTQFKPRSHYTKNDALGGYFRAMMFLGRNGFPLNHTDATGDAMLACLVIARTPAKGNPPLKAWKELMEITGFFAGQSDDITYPEFRAWIAASLGQPALDTTAALAPDNLATLSNNLGKLRKPLIVSSPHTDQLTSPDSDPPAFRIFGQRFTWDARVLDRFTRGAPATMPSIPTTAMIAAAFGDPFAEKVAREFVASHAAEFDRRLPAVRQEIAAVNDASWFSSMAAKQLHVLSTLALPRTAHFPAFMRGDAFAAKNLESFLGSYTELKHDTVLYAKQVYAEAGEGGDSDKAPPPPHGFVQPDVPFWREMERLAIFAADGMARHKLIPDAAEEFSRFHLFARDVGAFRKIAEKEVAGAKLTTDEWETIRTTDFSYMASPLLSFDEPKPGDGKCALVTDVLTDASSGSVLQIALGRPYVMLALVGGNGGKRMVAGLAYNHFEFSRPLDAGRLSNEEWQQAIYQDQPVLPAKQKWHPPASTPLKLEPTSE